MENITLNDLLAKIKEYNEEEVEHIRKAYYYAENLHKGQYRQSGEEYITHPLNGDIVELPKGATVIDLAYKIGTDVGNTLVSAEVNNEVVLPETVLHNKDKVKLNTDIYSFGPRDNWLHVVKTTHAKRKIREFRNDIKN